MLGVQQCLGLSPDAVAVSVELHRGDAVDGLAAAGFADSVVAAGGVEFAVRQQFTQHLDGNAGVGVMSSMHEASSACVSSVSTNFRTSVGTQPRGITLCP